MVDSFEIQTEAQVKAIESRKMIQDVIEQTVPNNDVIDSSYITQQISNLENSINSLDNINLNEISDKIDNIDTNIIEAQIENILIKIQSQQKQINNIEEKLDIIINKI